MLCGRNSRLPWFHGDIPGRIVDPEHGGALIARADDVGAGPAGVVGRVSAGHEVTVRPPVEIQLEGGLDAEEAVADRVGRGGVSADDVVRGVGVDWVRVAVPRDGAQGVALHGAGQAHGAPVEGGA